MSGFMGPSLTSLIYAFYMQPGLLRKLTLWGCFIYCLTWLTWAMHTAVINKYRSDKKHRTYFIRLIIWSLYISLILNFTILAMSIALFCIDKDSIVLPLSIAWLISSLLGLAGTIFYIKKNNRKYSKLA